MVISDMVEGYLAGLHSESIDLPECHAKKSPSFKHGWLNGRDDRQGTPRERFDVLRRRANMIIGEQS